MHRSYRWPFWLLMSFCFIYTLTQVQNLCFERRFVVFDNCLASDPLQVVPFRLSQNIDAAFAQSVAQRERSSHQRCSRTASHSTCVHSQRQSDSRTPTWVLQQTSDQFWPWYLSLHIVTGPPSTVSWSTLFTQDILQQADEVDTGNASIQGIRETEAAASVHRS